MSGRRKQKIESKDNDSLLDELLKDLDNISAEELQLEGDPTISINKKKAPDGDRTKVAKAILFTESEPEYTKHTEKEKNELNQSLDDFVGLQSQPESEITSVEKHIKDLAETDLKIKSQEANDNKTKVVSRLGSEGVAKVAERKKEKNYINKC